MYYEIREKWKMGTDKEFSFNIRRNLTEVKNFIKEWVEGWKDNAEDDEYKMRPQKAMSMVGDIAVYRKSDGEVVHVGIIVSTNPNLERGEIDLEVLSQFGADGEYIHKEDDLPERLLYGKPGLSVWTEAVNYE